MNPAARAKAMLIDPAAEWASIARESGDPAYLLSRYVAVLALIPVVFGFIGSNLIGMVVPGTGLVRASLFNGGFGAIFAYALAFAILLLPGLRFLILLGFYGAYVLLLGLPRLMKAPKQKSYLYALVIVVCAAALTLGAAATQRAVFNTAF